MVKMYITVLLAIPVEKVKEKADRRKSSKKGKKGGRPSVPEETDPFVFRVGKASYYGHLEYNLIPNILTYTADITCWEHVAKIYTADGVRASKAIIHGNTCWVAFSLRHSVALTNEQLLQLREHQIVFNYWPSEKRVGQRAKSDRPTVFKALGEHVPESEIDFIELFENDNDVQIPSSMKSFLNPNMGEIVSLPWAVPYEKHWDCVVETIEISEEKLETVDTSPIEGPSEKLDARASKASKSGKRKSATEGSEHMSASAEALFTDSQEARCQIRSSNVQFMLAIISAVDLMTPKQMVIYNPLMVNIHKLKGLPTEFLKENGFKSLYVKYNVPGVGALQTAEKKLDDTTNIEFNDSHAIFTNDIPRAKLIEFIQTGYLSFEETHRDIHQWRPKIRGMKLVAERSHGQYGSAIFAKPDLKILTTLCLSGHDIYGVRDLPKQASVFGQEEMDEWIGSKLLHTVVSNCHQDIFPPSTNVLLGVARVDLSDLMNVAARTIRESVPVQLPKESFENGCTFLSNVLEINEFLMRKYQGSPCTNLMLSENNTRLRVSVKLLASLTYLLWELQLSSENFNRLFAIINNRLTAVEIINEIYGSNERCLGAYTGVPNFCKGEANSEIPEEQSEKEEEDKLSVAERTESSENFNDESVAKLNYELRRHQYLTGFAVDSFDKLLLFVEGPPGGKLQEIHQMLTEPYIHETNSTVFYNSNLVFEGRLYEDFKPYGGLYTITLREKIENKLVHFSAYQEERIPAPTLRALLKFSLLLKASDMAAACRNHYFPSPSDLMNFDRELGVPLRYEMDS